MDGMPNIPDFKGIVTSGTDALIDFGSAALVNLVFGNVWGVVNEYGLPILLADNVISVKYQMSSSISQAPIESGSFTSYNKVQEPFKATVQFSKGTGGTFERGAFLGQLEMLANSTLLFHVITPEYVYTNASITGYDTAREATDGHQLIKVNLHLEEVREVSVEYSEEEVANHDDAKKKDIGEKTPIGSDTQSTYKQDKSILNKSPKAFKELFTDAKNLVEKGYNFIFK